MTLTIEQDVPLPPPPVRNAKYLGVQPGDSFIVQTESRANSACTSMRQRGQEATYRKQADGTYRVWRTK